MRTSIINHPENEPLIIIRQWQSDFCDGNEVAAFIIGEIQLGRMGQKLLPTPFTYYDLQIALLGIYSVRKIKKAVKLLIKKKAIRKTDFSRKEIVKRLKSKKPQEFIQAYRSCEWCKCKTLGLQQHHYPIPAKDGGTSTVSICANCHYEYHFLRDNDFYVPTSELFGLINCYPLDNEVLP